MKKILFAAMAALAITSCSQNEEIEAPSQKAEIGFKTAVSKAQRAVDVTNSNFNAFTINSYITDAAYDGTTELPDPYMNEALCTNNAGNWSIDGTYYWPASKVVNFFAYSTLGGDTLSYTKGSAWPTLKFKMAGTTDNLRDVVAACATGIDLKNSSVSSDGKLTLTFNHILTRINFSVIYADDTYTYTINNIKIKGVKPEGTYTYKGDATTGAWVVSGAATDYTYPINPTLPSADADKKIKLDATNGSIIAIPQELTGVTIEVNYKTEKDGTEFFNDTKVVTFTAADTWEINKNIRYILTLPVGATEMGVATNVTPWSTPENEEGHNPVTPAS